jgi:hypothetical protein
MSYEHAPATRLVAKHCCICGRALLDAVSLASGIGPVCAEKTRFHRADLSTAVRAEVNKLVYELAALQRAAEAVPHLARLRELGFIEVADRVEERLAELVTIRIELVNRVGLVVELPHVDQDVFLKLVADLRSVPGRQWCHVPGRPTKVNVIPNSRDSIHALYRVLARTFPGTPTRSPKGTFLMPSETEVEAAFSR